MKKIVVTIVILFAVTLSSAFATGQPEGTSTGGLQVVRFASDGFLLGSQSWVAEDRGYFAEEKLDAKVSLFGTGIEAIQAVIAQQADLGPALDFAVLNLAAAAKENMEVVACIAAPLPGFHSLAVQNNINGPQDLVGKKIGYVAGTSEHYVTIRYLEQNGIDLSKVQLIPFPGLFELVGALRTDAIQASWLWLTGTEEAKKDPGLKILTNDSNVLNAGAIYLVTRTQWAKDNEDTLIRVLRAYDKASKYIAANNQSAADIIAKSVKGDAKLFAGIIPNQRYRVAFTQAQLDSFDAMSKFLIGFGKLPADFDIRKFINFDAMEKAVPGSVQAKL